ncbi:unnamed protein product [Nezara viridula]|uniref:THAP-type domain-containing protein n=1 Tax=Nezara viridula TaxID=85310 RepID=A0A9P0HBZ1_NEZVI|nr:unnamed protein product [Nezara viridula]
MVHCSACGCFNSTEKGFSMKRFPRDPERRKVWAANVKRDNWTPTNDSRICEAHFTPDMFEQNRADGRRLLKQNAVPTIFSHIPEKKPREPPKKRSIEITCKSEKESVPAVNVVHCSAVGCLNSTEKGFSMKRFPRDPERRKVWAANVKRDNWTPTNDSHICEAHFTPDMFKQNRADGRRLLKQNAIPTIFSHIPEKKPRKPPKKRSIEITCKSEEESVPAVDIVHCSAFGCFNSTEKGFIMKQFPRDPEQRKVWAAKVNRDNWTLTNESYICEAHFTPDMFEQNRADGRRLLKQNAIPTIFSHIQEKKPRTPPKKRSIEITCKSEEESVPAVDAHFTPDMFEQIRAVGRRLLKQTAIPTVSSHIPGEKLTKPPTKSSPIEITCNSTEEESVPAVDICSTVDSNTATVERTKDGVPSSSSTAAVERTQEDGIPSSTSSSSSAPSPTLFPQMKQQELLKTLIKSYNKIVDKNNRLKVKLRKMKNILKKKQENIYLKCLKKVFTNNQIKALMKDTVKSKTKWDSNTIIKALKMKFACGSNGYNELIAQNFPLPSHRTLRRRVLSVEFCPAILKDV